MSTADDARLAWRRIKFPAGTTTLTNPLIISEPCIIEGEGRAITTLLVSGDYGIVIRSPSTGIDNPGIQIRDLTLKASNPAAKAGIWIGDTTAQPLSPQKIILFDVQITDFNSSTCVQEVAGVPNGGIGILLSQVQQSVFEQVYIDNCYRGLVEWSNANATTCTFYKASFRLCSTTGVRLTRARTFAFRDCVFESNGAEGFYMDGAQGGGINILIDACHCESNSATSGAGQIVLRDSRGVQVRGLFMGDTQQDGLVMTGIEDNVTQAVWTDKLTPQYEILTQNSEHTAIVVYSGVNHPVQIDLGVDVFPDLGNVEVGGSGWIDDGAIIRLTTSTDAVVIGGASVVGAEKLRVMGGNIRVDSFIEWDGIAAPAVSPAGDGRIYFDSGANRFRVSENGGGYIDLFSDEAPLDAPYLTDGADATLTAERNIQALTATLVFANNTAFAGQPATFERADTSTNTALTALAVRRTSTGTPAAGIGTRLSVETEVTAGFIESGRLETTVSNVGAAVEDSTISLYALRNGSMVEVYRADPNTGNTFIGPSGVSTELYSLADTDTGFQWSGSNILSVQSGGSTKINVSGTLLTLLSGSSIEALQVRGGSGVFPLYINGAGGVGANNVSFGASLANSDRRRMVIQFPTVTPLAINTSLDIIDIIPLVTESSSGSHPRLTGVNIRALGITVDDATTDDAASLRVEGPPVGATSNYAVWVDDGNVRLDGKLAVGGTVNTAYQVLITQPAETSGTPSALVVTGGVHTGLTAGVQASDLVLDFGRTVTFAAGNITNQHAIRILRPTYAFSGGTAAIDMSATVYIDNAPGVGANDTSISASRYAVWVDAGNVRLDGQLIMNDDQISANFGALLAPGLGFNGDNDLGLLRASENIMNAVSAGTRVTAWGTTGFEIMASNTPAGSDSLILYFSGTTTIGNTRQIQLVNETDNSLESYRLAFRNNAGAPFAWLDPNAWFILDEADSSPGTGLLDANDSVAFYTKANTLVFAYNNAGTMTYVKLPLDGSATTWVHDTIEPT